MTRGWLSINEVQAPMHGSLMVSNRRDQTMDRESRCNSKDSKWMSFSSANIANNVEEGRMFTMDGILEVILSRQWMLHFQSHGFARTISLWHGNLDTVER